jgi:carboxylesterase type B
MGDIPILKSFPEEIGNLYSQFNSTFSDISEDCLTLTVQRPANVSVDAKLPVLVSIYGGGFMAGAISGFDYTQFVAKSIELAEPVILVAMNYRVGPFGFLGGKELMAEGNTNLGLRDQRLALEWVHENIGAFGGDAEKGTQFLHLCQYST